jgi:ribosomal protein S1
MDTNMSALSAGAVLSAKYADLQPKKQLNNDASIENIVQSNTTNNTSIELPDEIKALITGNDFWVNAKSNRYKKLIREGHLDKLLVLANMAQTKNNPANWFAKACSREMWERTLAFIAKLKEVARKADNVARRLGTKVNKFIYKMIWNGVNVERWAVAAEEIKHDKPGQSREKHFAWLCLNEQRL